MIEMKRQKMDISVVSKDVLDLNMLVVMELLAKYASLSVICRTRKMKNTLRKKKCIEI